MPQLDHLQLIRLPETLPRRKTGFPGPTPPRGGGYGRLVRTEVEAAVEAQLQNRPAQFVDPSLILCVRMNGMLLEEDWEALGLTLLSSDDDKNIVLFSSAGDLAALMQRLDAFDGPIHLGRQVGDTKGSYLESKVSERWHLAIGSEFGSARPD